MKHQNKIKKQNNITFYYSIQRRERTQATQEQVIRSRSYTYIISLILTSINFDETKLIIIIIIIKMPKDPSCPAS